MTVRSLLVILLLIYTLNALNPAYLQRQQQHLASLIEAVNKQIDEHEEANLNAIDDDDNNQFEKRNKYPNFHLSPLWLSRGVRTTRMYGKPLWISRAG